MSATELVDDVCSEHNDWTKRHDGLSQQVRTGTICRINLVEARLHNPPLLIFKLLGFTEGSSLALGGGG